MKKSVNNNKTKNNNKNLNINVNKTNHNYNCINNKNNNNHNNKSLILKNENNTKKPINFLSKKSTIKEFEKNFYKLKASWGKNSFEKSLLTLSFWLSEINKKAHNSKCENIDTLYNLKTKALREIKDFVTIRYYSPKKNYKEEFIFCNYHNAIYDKGYSVFWEFIDKYKIRSCPDCKVNRIEKYYNLYLFDVRDKKGKMQFTFHLPHSIGKDFLPDEKNLTNIKYLKDEFSIFKLNGLLKKNEHFIFEGDYLENKFENALKSFMNEKNKLDK